jgi:hypothetical protein
MAKRQERKTGQRLLKILFPPVWYGDNLPASPGTLLRAAAIVGALFIILVGAYLVFDLGSILPTKPWRR